ncbi:MAG: ABC transporter permease [Treponema sp.]|jgi:phospholipid/cholesterol/gamma-HCH transport system permease protein|nr:ABC transporter permease [Treponema sp.]
MGGVLYNLGFFFRTLRGIKGIFRTEASRKILVMQIFFTFVQALGLASVLALGIGAAVNITGIPFLTQLSQERLIYTLLIMIITRELGPLLGAFIIISRSATAIATEMAGMVISHEVEAYISVGVDPIEHLAAPRFLGVTISMFLLNVYFSLFGLAGSFLVAQLFNAMPPGIYFGNLLGALAMGDLLVSFIKSVAFGMIISMVAIIKGLSVERASTEVPVAGLHAVSSAFGGCVAADIFITVLYYMVQ